MSGISTSEYRILILVKARPIKLCEQLRPPKGGGGVAQGIRSNDVTRIGSL